MTKAITNSNNNNDDNNNNDETNNKDKMICIGNFLKIDESVFYWNPNPIQSNTIQCNAILSMYDNILHIKIQNVCNIVSNNLKKLHSQQILKK